MMPGRTKGPNASAKAGEPSNPLEYEILQEQAATLGRVARDLQQALRMLEEFDRTNPDKAALSPEDRLRRSELVGEAGEILWWLVVQREACGLYRTDQLLIDYRVPPEVRVRMGIRRSAP